MSTADPDATSRGAILLAGGRASRMGGIDKPSLKVNGRSLLDAAVAAVTAVGCEAIVIVGPRPGDGKAPGHGREGSGGEGSGGAESGGAESGNTETTASERAGIEWRREDPPFAGPAAAIATALAAPHPRGNPAWTFVLACDLPHVEQAVARLDRELGALPPDSDGACLADATGRSQWLTGVYRTVALRAAASALPDAGRDQSVRALLAGLAVTTIADDAHVADDIDTWDDYERFTGDGEPE
ncbi:NTP transferase domain-containing protein [Planctomonas sp. JC2975]|uniref:molybdenum cofactor guanylyltransferase n=1 Tax=Planctomonas sp. JC2975 TaxID=2729626 RepID=UPI001475F1E8|nr:NTP transferase domain-containing protein [Planctomonas sp. JC2975]NNC11982.1 NTP transferase domain-containing protein [Planctomonas sp. JC2975]